MNTVVRWIRKAVRRKGFDMIHYVPWENLLAHFSIDLILDVGANVGQTYESFRWAGFQGPIVSFEPCPATFRQLETRPGFAWQRRPYALSNKSGELKFYVTANDNANSLQKPSGGLPVLSEIVVPAYRLDELWAKEGFSARNAFLKIDAEGHDLEVFKGAAGVLDRIPLVMLEVAPLPRFEGEPPLPEVVHFMEQSGYSVCRAEKNSFHLASGVETALDIVFARREALAKLPR
jgi:FkbM family methyltransferase